MDALEKEGEVLVFRFNQNNWQIEYKWARASGQTDPGANKQFNSIDLFRWSLYYMLDNRSLTLKAPITTAADICFIFFLFSFLFFLFIYFFFQRKKSWKKVLTFHVNRL